METQAFTFAASRFVLVAIGFCGLGTGYFIWRHPENLCSIKNKEDFHDKTDLLFVSS